MTVIYGNRTFPRPREYADDRSDLKVASFPKLLRSVALRLNQQGCWLAEALEDVARDWNDDEAANIAKLREVLAHDNLLTPAQISYVRAALNKLHERSDSDVQVP